MLKSVVGRCAVRCCTNFTLCYQCVDIDLNAAAVAAAALMAATAERGRTSMLIHTRDYFVVLRYTIAAL